MKNLIYLSFAFLVSAIGCFAQTGINYVEASLPSQAWKNGWEVNKQVGTTTVASREYLDGLGRPKQTVTIKGSPLKKDFVLPQEYDPAGREPKVFLPYAATTDDGSYKGSYSTEQATFYNNAASNNADKVVNDAYPFTKNNYEASPLGRIVKSYSPGAAWQTGIFDRSSEINLRANTASDNVKNWVYDPATGNANASTNYAAGALYMTESKDEDKNSTLEFKDKLGRVILKRQWKDAVNFLSTYYVYDDFNNLRYVVPPAYTSTSITYAGTGTDEYLFAYLYDAKRRVTEKKVPGAGITYYVYDKYDRLLISQDANQRASFKWHYAKYDVHARPIMTGIYTHTGVLTQAAMQTLVNGYTTPQNEIRQVSTTHGYSNQAWPTANCEVLTVNYYDDYDFDYNGSADHSSTAQSILTGSVPDYSVKTRLTGTKAKILGSTNDWMRKVYFYDAKKRGIQVLSNNQMNLANMSDTETTLYDFAGKPITIHVSCNPGTGAVTFAKEMQYDHASRLLKVLHTIGAVGRQGILYELKYNEAGQVVEKNLGKEYGQSSFVQSLDFTYNIRGFLSQLNNPGVQGMASNNDDANDLMNLALFYNEQYGYNDQNDLETYTPRFNGNISGMAWKSANAASPAFSTTKTYRYDYDRYNRLFYADCGVYNPTTNLFAFDGGHAENIGYDANGNITSLIRSTPTGGTLVDNLSYTYIGNRLRKVKDLITTSFAYGFTDGVDIADEYSYDANGNMTSNANSNMTFQYNHLNKLTQFGQAGAIWNYGYDAYGNKLKVTTSYSTGQLGPTRYYIGPFLYTVVPQPCTNCTTYVVQNEVGRCKKWGSGHRYEYDIKDHLGNVVMTVDKDPTTNVPRIIQEDHYYPFGMKMEGLSYDNSSGNRFLYNGKELQTEFGMYDYGARFYDPVLGRWHVVDPSSEDGGQESFTPYGYVFDNPIKYNDPDGRCPTCGDGSPYAGPSGSFGGLDNGEVGKAIGADLISVKHSAYNLALSFFGSDKRVTFVENEDGDLEERAIETNLTFTEDLVNFGLDAVSVFSLGKGGGPTGGIFAKTPGKQALTNQLKTSNILKNVGRSGKQTRLKELATDPKVGKADKGWIKNEIRHIENGNRKTIRLPGNSRNSKSPGKVLAHPKGKRAKDGHSYEEAKIQDTDLHKLEHKYEGY